jgi:hypothetical protein
MQRAMRLTLGIAMFGLYVWLCQWFYIFHVIDTCADAGVGYDQFPPCLYGATVRRDLGHWRAGELLVLAHPVGRARDSSSCAEPLSEPHRVASDHETG